MTVNVDLADRSYAITIQHGILQNAAEFINLNRKVLIVTDDGVPDIYAATVAKQCKKSVVVTVKQGEGSKTFPVFEKLCRTMLENDFTRHDCVVAVGGGVVGDLSGFAAACFMRGIDFYNIPTTVLSQVDSSIGGKVAINLDKIKNIIGAFYQPKAVLIDPDVLKTLPDRQIANGLSEAIKMGLTSDKDLFALFQKDDYMQNLDLIIEKSLTVKKNVVEQDEKEGGLRKILNFGHTIGHAFESNNFGNLYHGECVALGMLYMCSDSVRAELIPVLKRVGLPTEIKYDKELIIEALKHDKKSADDSISVIYVPEIGKFEINNKTITELGNLL